MTQKRRYKLKYEPVKYCEICETLLKGSFTYEKGICSKCFTKDPQFKADRNERQKQYWKDKKDKYEEMKERRRSRYYQKGT